MTKSALQDRLRNCLQTILELEPEIERLELGERLLKEFTLLKSFVERLGSVEVNETDVRRIEEATASFLEELKEPMSLVVGQRSGNKILQ